MDVNIEFERGVVVTEDGSFVAAVQWQKGTPKPSSADLNGTRAAGSTAPKLRLVTDPEAVADPIPKGRWDAKAKVWRKPNVPVWIVNVRRDDPRYGVLAGSRMIWPQGPMPTLQAWQRLVTVEPPATRAGRKPLFDFEAGEWVVPVSVVVVREDGTKNIVVKPRQEKGDTLV
jgi:hypothetical protein